MSTNELRTYGWRRDGLIWRRPKPHLTVVPDAKPRKRYEKKVTCACGQPMWKDSARCKACHLSSLTAPTPRRKIHASDHGVDELMEVIGRNLRTTPVPPLPVHLCDGRSRR
jgi:hypothetical protein